MVLQRRLRNVQKSMMHVQSCFFFCRSRCRRRCRCRRRRRRRCRGRGRNRCLSSLMSHSVLQRNTRKIYFEEYVRLDVGLLSSIFSGGGTGDESSSCFLAYPHPDSASQKFACRPLITSLILYYEFSSV